MYFVFRAMGLAYTRRCSFECSHCYYHSTPDSDGHLGIDAAVKAARAVRGKVAAIAITGGEPLLFPEEIREVLLQSPTEIPFYIVSNAFWATSRELARKTLAPVVEAGLKAMVLSYDEYHSAFIDADRLIYAIEFAQDLGIDLRLAITGSLDSDPVRRVLEYAVENEIDHTKLGVALSGRAKDCVNPKHCSEIKVGGCAGVLSLSLNWSGDLRACCGPSFSAGPESGMYLGNMFKDNLRECIDAAERDVLLGAIAVKGPLWLERLGKRSEDPLPDTTLGPPCDACLGFMRDAKAREIARNELLQSHERKRIAASMMLMKHETELMWKEMRKKVFKIPSGLP